MRSNLNADDTATPNVQETDMHNPADFDVLTHRGTPCYRDTETGRLYAIPSGGVEDDGGGGEGEGGDTGRTEPGTTEPGTQETTEGAPRDAGDTGETRAKGPVPYERFEEVNGRLGKYRDLGEPETVRERLLRLDAIERREADENQRRLDAQEREDGLSPQERQALGVLEKLLPKLSPKAAAAVIDRIRPGSAAQLARLPQNEELQIQQHHAGAFRELREALGTYEGIKLEDDATLGRYATLVETEILNDPQLKQAYWTADRPKVMADAVERVIKGVINPALQASGARALARAAERRRGTLSRPAPGGTSQPKPNAFTSKHDTGTREYERDRKAFRSREIATILADQIEEAS